MDFDAKEFEHTPEKIRDTISRTAQRYSALSFENDEGLKACEKIAKQCVELNLITEKLDEKLKEKNLYFSTIFSKLVKIAQKRKKREKQVVFVSDRPFSRQAKMAYALKKNGWQVILLCRTKPSFSDVDKYFDCVLQCCSTEEILISATLFSPQVYHLFSSWDFDVALRIIESGLSPTVFDDYDVLGGCLQTNLLESYSQSISKEKNCLENADALCNRSLLYQISKKHLNYKLPKEKIFFPEYCWGEERKLKEKREDGIHVVFVGCWHLDSFEDPEGLHCFDKNFINAFAGDGIHYHLYSSFDVAEIDQSKVQPWIDLAKENDHFHFHHFLPYEEMLQEISQYHLGIITFARKILETGEWNYNPLAFRYFMANKLFDYLDAGLGIVLYCGQTMRWFFERTGTTLIADRETLLSDKSILKKFCADQDLASKIRKAQQKLSVVTQGARLVNFYEKVSIKDR